MQKTKANTTQGDRPMKWQALAAAALFSIAATSHAAEKKYRTGVTDTEIKLGQTSPFSGAASAYSVIAKAQAAYFRMINDEGGVNGRKINLITLDDAYTPPKTVEQTQYGPRPSACLERVKTGSDDFIRSPMAIG
jgi:ABC-type branched-subunit amino acid transport system substrate-binding protein